MKMILFIFLLTSVSKSMCDVAYPLLDYTPLSDEAKSTGQLEYYEKTPKVTHNLDFGGLKLKFTVPVKARAYDVIPIEYEYEKPRYYGQWSAIEVVAFENISKVSNNDYYSLNIPGNLSIKMEYLGSVCANYKQDDYIPLTADPNTPVSPFPPFERDNFTNSSLLKKADIVWFKIRLTNTGDTILDPEGFSASFLEPEIQKLSDDGKVICSGKPTNLFVRHLEYLYPNDSTELWVDFVIHEFGKKLHGLEAGNYKIIFKIVARFYGKYNWMANIWSGSEFARLEVPITVNDRGGWKKADSIFIQNGRHSYQFPGYWGKYEEFMSSFTIYPTMPMTLNKTMPD